MQAGISALREFVMVGKAGFSALRGERVKGLLRSLKACHVTKPTAFIPSPSVIVLINYDCS